MKAALAHSIALYMHSYYLIVTVLSCSGAEVQGLRFYNYTLGQSDIEQDIQTDCDDSSLDCVCYFGLESSEPDVITPTFPKGDVNFVSGIAKAYTGPLRKYFC